MKNTILQALSAFVRQRRALKFGNYGDAPAYRAELRRITQQRHDAEKLLAAVATERGISHADILAAAQIAFCGRLVLEVKGRSVKVEYRTGQYFPVEYRAAVCAVLSLALWRYWAQHLIYRPGYVLKHARKVFGRGIASRWFA